MPYYKTCPDCGAHLDPQEKCDCHRPAAKCDLLEAYRRHLHSDGRAPNTVSTYMAALERLNAFLGRAYAMDLRVEADMRAVSSEHLHAYHDSLSLDDLSRNTRNLFVSAIRGFFGFVVEQGRREDNPALSLRRKKREYGEAPSKPDDMQFYTLEKLQVVVDYLQGLQKRNKKRDLALFTLMCASGLRVSEACSLNIGDMDSIRRGEVHIIGKGGSLQKASVGAFALPYLEAHLEARGCSDPSAPLFLTQKKKRMDRFAAWKAFKRFQTPCDAEGRGTHGCRHTAITYIAHLNGIMAARDVARHRDAATTNRYIHRLDDVVTKATNTTPVGSVFDSARVPAA